MDSVKIGPISWLLRWRKEIGRASRGAGSRGGEEGARAGGWAAVIDGAVEAMAGVEQVGDRAADSHPHDVLVLDVGAQPPRSFPAPEYLREEVIFRIMVIVRIGAPGQLAARDVVAQVELDPTVAGAADRPLLAGQRVPDTGLLEPEY